MRRDCDWERAYLIHIKTHNKIKPVSSPESPGSLKDSGRGSQSRYPTLSQVRYAHPSPHPGPLPDFLSLLSASDFSARRDTQARAGSLGSSISRRGGAGGGVSRRPSPRGRRRPSPPYALIAVAARPTPPARVRGRARAQHGPDGGDPGFRGR